LRARRCGRAIAIGVLATVASAAVLAPGSLAGGSHIVVESGGQDVFVQDVLSTSVGINNLIWDWDVDGTTNRAHNVR
jgi:hypothetical protein